MFRCFYYQRFITIVRFGAILGVAESQLLILHLSQLLIGQCTIIKGLMITFSFDMFLKSFSLDIHLAVH